MKISIITATYNSEKTLRDTLDSILAQTYPDIESIIVDGASKDGTLDIVREYETKFQGRMHWISEPDKGIYDAMNKGIKMASGDVIGVLNSDDFYYRKTWNVYTATWCLLTRTTRITHFESGRGRNMNAVHS